MSVNIPSEHFIFSGKIKKYIECPMIFHPAEASSEIDEITKTICSYGFMITSALEWGTYGALG